VSKEVSGAFFEKVPDTFWGERVDKFLAARLGITRGRAQQLQGAHLVLVNGKIVKNQYRLKKGDEVEVLGDLPPPPSAVEPEFRPLTVRFEDASLLVVDKPPGLVVHPAPGVTSGTLVNALVGRGQPLSTMGGQWRPGIVHRLDKDTSGLLVIAKTDSAHRHLMEQLRNRTLQREYLVLVHGRVVPSQGTVDAPIGRHPVHRHKLAVMGTPSMGLSPLRGKVRRAITHFEVLERFSSATLLRVKLETGRTHQIRVHMKHLKHPVAGDVVYGGQKTVANGIAVPRQALHAARLTFVHPVTDRTITVESPWPDDLQRVLQALRALR